MTEIGFYHLTRTAGDQALPALLGRTLDAGERALVLCGSPGRVAALDEALWACTEPAWLPHAGEGAEDAGLQPIWLTHVWENPNGARFLFLLDGAEAAETGQFARVFDLFDGRDQAAVDAARRRWAAAKKAGHGLTYWRQTERGWTKGPE